MAVSKEVKLKPKLIRVIIPYHYGAKGMWWESKFVTEAELPSVMAAHPNLEIYAKRREKDAVSR